MDATDRLIVALDVGSRQAAERLVEQLGPAASFYKIGYQLLLAGGLELCPALVDAGKRVFLDLKLHDIAATVASSVENVARLGVTFLTVHGYPQTMEAAVGARAGSDLKILAVTALTSYDDRDLHRAGYALGVRELVERRAAQACELGVDGIVCSPREARALRERLGPQLLLVTPAVRPSGSPAADQKRVMTPREAVAAGADYLVVGRPILASDDPRRAAEAIIAEINSATTNK